jgi:hypothetical protein
MIERINTSEIFIILSNYNDKLNSGKSYLMLLLKNFNNVFKVWAFI